MFASRFALSLSAGCLAIASLMVFAPATLQAQNAPAQAEERLPAGDASILGMSLIEDDRGRIVVSDVRLDTPAAAAKLKKGDFIAALEGKEVESLTQLMDDAMTLVRSPEKPETLRFTVIRDGKAQQVALALAPQSAPGPRPQAADPATPGVTAADLGLTELNKVVHVRPGSSPAAAGIMPGDVISAVAGRKTPNFRALVAEMSAFGANDFVPIQITRNGNLVNLEIEGATTIALHPQPEVASGDLGALEARIQALEAQVETLTRAVENLSQRLTAIEGR